MKHLTLFLFFVSVLISNISAGSFLDDLSFEKIDKDQNGKISLNEVKIAAKGDSRYGYAFKMLDSDVNGYVDHKEFDYFYEQLKRNAEEIERRLSGTNIKLK